MPRIEVYLSIQVIRICKYTSLEWRQAGIRSDGAKGTSAHCSCAVCKCDVPLREFVSTGH